MFIIFSEEHLMNCIFNIVDPTLGQISFQANYIELS